MNGLLRRLVLQGREHMHVTLATVRPDSSDLVRLHDFVVLEWVEIILDMNRSFLHDLGAKEWIGCRR